MANLELAIKDALEPDLYWSLTMAAARISAQKINELEKRIGHAFKSHERLVRALTHSSATKRPGDISHYERLEFLGDRVLGLCIAEMLFFKFPAAREGELSVRLNSLVSGNACAEIADEIGLKNFIHAGSDVKHLASKRMQSVRADVTESLIAAVYLDGGLEAAQKFVNRFWGDRINEENAGIRDSKTALQEWAHVQYEATPVYRINKRTGPDHAPTFIVEAIIDGAEGAIGTGRSKRAAEQAAAQIILLREAVWIEAEDGVIKENNK